MTVDLQVRTITPDKNTGISACVPVCSVIFSPSLLAVSDEDTAVFISAALLWAVRTVTSGFYGYFPGFLVL